MPNPTHYQSTRLLLRKMYNVRDLGGYPTRDGKTTAFGRFLRADAPVGLQENDRSRLLDFPVHSVIDLRSPSEIRKAANSLSDHRQIEYTNIPLLGKDMMKTLIGMNDKPDQQRFVQLHEIYINLLVNTQKQIGEVFSRMATPMDGASLFHCTHGKDRTGLVAALLLMLAGVDDVDIIANYQISATYLKPLFETFIADIDPDTLHFFETQPQSMEKTLAFFHDEYTSAEDYLSVCGLSVHEISFLKQRLTDN